MNSKGFSIIELLIVMAIGALLAGGLFTAYRFIAKENVSRVLAAKSESDIETMLYQVVKDIETAGFGIEKYKSIIQDEVEKRRDGTLICGNFETSFTNPDCVNTSNDAGIRVGNSLIFYSLASRQEKYSGCWAVIKNDNKFDVEDPSPVDGYLGRLRKNFLWQPCHLKDEDNTGGTETKMKANYYYIIMTRDRVKRNVSTLCLDELCQCGLGGGIQCDSEYKIDDKEQLFAFFATRQSNLSYPTSFRVSYFLDHETSTLNKFCAVNDDGRVYNLYKQVNPDVPQPIINCVLKDSLRFRAGIQSGSTVNYTTNDSTIRDAIKRGKLRSLKMCMVIQLGGKQLDEKQAILTAQKPVFISSDCGDNPSISDEWWNQTGRYYRWKVIEKEIPLYNFQ